jgi:predicted nucleic acid-binding protein
VLILDTNVISELMKADPLPAVFAWAASHPPAELFTSTITMAEVLYGIEILPHGKRRDQLHREAESIFLDDFAGRVLAFDEASARMFAVVAAQRRAQGRPIEESDAQIAAIVRVNHGTLVTRNTDDFEGCGIQLVNPWES